MKLATKAWRVLLLGAPFVVGCASETPEPQPTMSPGARPDIVETLRADLEMVRHASDGGGRAWVELRDKENNTLKGYRFEDCDVIKSVDSLEHAVTWHGRSDLGQLNNHPVWLALRLQQGQLYTFRFVPEE